MRNREIGNKKIPAAYQPPGPQSWWRKGVSCCMQTAHNASSLVYNKKTAAVLLYRTGCCPRCHLYCLSASSSASVLKACPGNGGRPARLLRSGCSGSGCGSRVFFASPRLRNSQRRPLSGSPNGCYFSRSVLLYRNYMRGKIKCQEFFCVFLRGPPREETPSGYIMKKILVFYCDF